MRMRRAVTVLAAAAALFAAGDAGSSAALTPAQKRLLASVPGEIRPTCVPGRHRTQRGAEAVLFCLANRERIGVWYGLYARSRSLLAAYERNRRAAPRPIPRDTGQGCAEEPTEAAYAAAGTVVGRFFCDRELMDWYDGRRLVGAHAVLAGVAPATAGTTLSRWWRCCLGPGNERRAAVFRLSAVGRLLARVPRPQRAACVPQSPATTALGGAASVFCRGPGGIVATYALYRTRKAMIGVYLRDRARFGVVEDSGSGCRRENSESTYRRGRAVAGRAFCFGALMQWYDRRVLVGVSAVAPGGGASARRTLFRWFTCCAGPGSP